MPAQRIVKIQQYHQLIHVRTDFIQMRQEMIENISGLGGGEILHGKRKKMRKEITAT